jgi:hypothetical protein
VNANEHGPPSGRARLSFGRLGAEEKGFLYVYLINEHALQTNVYFDDLKVTYNTSIESFDSYYPFGLTFKSFQRD